jgi:hypothetical protein
MNLRHHPITKLADSFAATQQTIMSIAGHVSIEMLRHYSHIGQEAKRKAVASLDNVTIASQLRSGRKIPTMSAGHRVASSADAVPSTFRLARATYSASASRSSLARVTVVTVAIAWFLSSSCVQFCLCNGNCGSQSLRH